MKSMCAVAVCVVLCFTGCSTGVEEYPERPANYGTLVGTIVSADTGDSLNARVYAWGSDDSLYFAVDCIGYDRPAFKERAGYNGRHFTTRNGSFTVHLPAGDARIRIEKGKEIIPLEMKVPITAGSVVKRAFPMKQWINMNALGWYSGDTHVHRDLDDLPDLMRAEGLNVALPQTVWGTERADSLDKWLAKADASGAVAVDSVTVFSALGHETERFAISAILLHHTGKTEMQMAGHQTRIPTNLSLIERTHELGGYCEAEKGWWPESHIDVAIGKADLTGIANNHMLYCGFLAEHNRKRDEFKPDYPDGIVGYVDYVLDLYYAYLNCGFHLMPTAGSASGVLPNPLGYNRVYVKVDGPFSYGKWIDGLVAGSSYVTNGPHMIVTVEGQDPGSAISIREGIDSIGMSCELYSRVPLSRFEVVYNGEVVMSAQPKMRDGAYAFDCDIPVADSGWICARCFEAIDDNVRFAHTAPFWITVGTKPFVPDQQAARYFLRKTDELIAAAADIQFPSEDARKETMAYYQRAKKVYGDIAARGK